MAALPYLLLPVSGLIAYFGAGSERVRFHGLQAVVWGSLWPTALYVCSWVTPGATQVAFVLGVLGWLVLMLAAAVGRDVRIPFVGRRLQRAAAVSPRAR